MRNKDKRKASNREYHLKQTYGISLADYDAMLYNQGGVCLICRQSPDKMRLAVDHDHKTGKIRGLLCSNCNIALGAVNDDIEILCSMIGYLSQSYKIE